MTKTSNLFYETFREGYLKTKEEMKELKAEIDNLKNLKELHRIKQIKEESNGSI